MPIALLHPGDLSLWELLLAIFMIVGLPALLIVGFAYVVWLAAKRERVMTIGPEENRDTTDRDVGRADRA